MISSRSLSFLLIAACGLAAHTLGCTVKTSGPSDPAGADGGAGTGTNTGTGTGTSTAKLSCEQVIACVQPCEDEKCVQACRDKASSDAMPKLGALNDCIETKASACEDDACIEKTCASEWNRCFGGG